MRVLHVIPSVAPRDGGPTTAMGLIENGLRSAGVMVTTLATDHEAGPVPVVPFWPAKQPPKDGRVFARKWTTAYKTAPSMIPWLFANVRAFDIVHVHALFSFAPVAAALIARNQSVPYVVRPLGVLGHYGVRQRRPALKRISIELIERRVLRDAAAVHFTTDKEREEASSHRLEFRGVVIPIGIEASPVAPGLGRRLAGMSGPEASCIVVLLSRLDPVKNVEALIDALGGSASLQAKIRLQIAGDGEPTYVQRLKSQASALGIDHLVDWLGYLGGADKAALLARADVFVLPSHSENFGIAAAEALLAGVPCVVSNGVAIANDIAAAGAGITVAPEPREIAKGLERLAFDPVLRREMGLRAERLANGRYSLAAMSAALVGLYTDILRKHASTNHLGAEDT